MSEEITESFVDYIKSELKGNVDADSKVVYASILQLIGESKGTDLLGNQSYMLKAADASLGGSAKDDGGTQADGAGNATARDDERLRIRTAAAGVYGQKQVECQAYL